MQPDEKEESDCRLSQVLYGGPDWGLGAPEEEAAPGGRQPGGKGERHTNTNTHPHTHKHTLRHVTITRTNMCVPTNTELHTICFKAASLFLEGIGLFKC